MELGRDSDTGGQVLVYFDSYIYISWLIFQYFGVVNSILHYSLIFLFGPILWLTYQSKATINPLCTC